MRCSACRTPMTLHDLPEGGSVHDCPECGCSVRLNPPMIGRSPYSPYVPSVLEPVFREIA